MSMLAAPWQPNGILFSGAGFKSVKNRFFKNLAFCIQDVLMLSLASQMTMAETQLPSYTANFEGSGRFW